MKVIQLMTHFYPCGQTKYVIEINKGLKANNVDVELFVFDYNQTYVSGNLDIDPNVIVKYVKFEQSVFDKLNTADAIFFHDMPLAKMEQGYIDSWVDMVKNKINGPKKVQFINAHNWSTNSKANGDLVRKKDFLDLMDKVVGFSKTDDFALYYKEKSGSTTFDDKFIHLLLPYYFDDTHSLWKPFHNKYRRLTYMGRCMKMKDPERIIEICPTLAKHGFECEMRGILRTIAVIGFKNLIYNYGTKDKSDKTFFLTKKYRDAHNISKEDNCVHLPREFKDKVYVFGEFKNKEGMEMISWSLFGCDFFNVPSKKEEAKNDCGDNGEYVMVEMFDVGTIPLVDYDFAKNCKLYKDGEWTGETWLSANLGIPLKDDLSNLDDVLNKMHELSNNEEYYNKYREYCFNKAKEHHNPTDIVKHLLIDIFK